MKNETILAEIAQLEAETRGLESLFNNSLAWHNKLLKELDDCFQYKIELADEQASYSSKEKLYKEESWRKRNAKNDRDIDRLFETIKVAEDEMELRAEMTKVRAERIEELRSILK